MMSTWMRSDSPEAKAYNQPEVVKCEYCGAVLPFEGMRKDGKAIWFKALPCDCEESQKEQERLREQAALERLKELRKERAKRIQNVIGETGPSKRFKLRTFGNFETSPDNEVCYKVAKRYAERFISLELEKDGERNGLMITGPCGAGKTHLAAAIANALIDEQIPVIFLNTLDLLDKIKSRYDGHKGASEDSVLSVYKTVDLLVIDDLGKEQPTEWACSKIYQIINARYEELKPTIITTNYTQAELIDRLTPKGGDRKTAIATVDRILEMAYTLPLAGESHRPK